MSEQTDRPGAGKPDEEPPWGGWLTFDEQAAIDGRWAAQLLARRGSADTGPQRLECRSCRWYCRIEAPGAKEWGGCASPESASGGLVVWQHSGRAQP